MYEVDSIENAEVAVSFEKKSTNICISVVRIRIKNTAFV